MTAWKKGCGVEIYHHNQSSLTLKLLQMKCKGFEFAIVKVLVSFKTTHKHEQKNLTVQQKLHKNLQVMKLVNATIFPTPVKCQVTL